ncbi:MAG TPA: archaeosine biosynthesis radical SAM protein RaSEA [Methanolinea sp.]|nr:archaeosine biosynthesis radical SAM protein RaSEA [Methanolinea sp.]HQK56790.1 archaeosine biosynthesis radical SAM protein RaSEA [Methanolinea sp.]
MFPKRESDRPLAAWAGRDRIQGQVMSALTIILKTGGCAHDRCRMCSYRHERYERLSHNDLEAGLRAQLAWIGNNFTLEDFEAVKIYTSGSLFDPLEVPVHARDALAKMLRGKIVIAETRPEYITEDHLNQFVTLIDNGTHETPLFVAIGVETSNDTIREKSIDKGFSCDDFLLATEIARSVGAGVKAYLLAKPLFLTEREAIDDMISSIRDLSGMADMISLNPCTVQRNTELEYYWKQGAYRPPYLWSILTILLESPVHLTCDPLGGGQERGPHNCGVCDGPLVKGIRDYSLSADRELLSALLATRCSCKEEWEFVLREERSYCMPLTR